MKKLYDSRAFWMIVSLLASITLWIYVSSVDKEEITRTFRGVKVELEGEDILRDSRELVITDMDTRDRKSTRLNSSHSGESRMPSSA